MKFCRLSQLLCLISQMTLIADEGMWTYDALPKGKIHELYGVDLSDQWFEHLKNASLRVGGCGSGSFVSKDGLVLTNHHVAQKAIANLSTKDRDLMQTGFLATKKEEELKCENFFIERLVSIEDVTGKIRSVLDETLSSDKIAERIRSEISKIKVEAKGKTQLEPEVVALYHGAIYHLYLYERYTDVRLVMAPEKEIAFMGGDADNFEFPRYDLDMTFLRVYKEGKPLQVKDYLKWSDKGPQAGNLLFVSGHPGSTVRNITSSQLQFMQDYSLPYAIASLKAKKKAYLAYAKESEEAKRIADIYLFSIENSLKVLKGMEKELINSSIFEKKLAFEESIAKDPTIAQSFKDIGEACGEYASYFKQFCLLESPSLASSKLFRYARHLWRLAEEVQKKNEDRLLEYNDADLETLKIALCANEPIYKGAEKIELILALRAFLKEIEEGHPLREEIRAFGSIESYVDHVVNGTTLERSSIRVDLLADLEKIQQSVDPMIHLAALMDPDARAIRKQKEERFNGVALKAYSSIFERIFESKDSSLKESLYPDATFTLRFSFGKMAGFSDEGKWVDPVTKIGGTFDHASAHHFKEPYALPVSWEDKEDQLNKEVPFNFISTHDIIGGNSGSPMVDEKGELVGLVFDGNKYSFASSYLHDEVKGRTISVHSEGMLEALRSIYHADSLIKELLAD